MVTFGENLSFPFVFFWLKDLIKSLILVIHFSLKQTYIRPPIRIIFLNVIRDHKTKDEYSGILLNDINICDHSRSKSHKIFTVKRLIDQDIEDTGIRKKEKKQGQWKYLQKS